MVYSFGLAKRFRCYQHWKNNFKTHRTLLNSKSLNLPHIAGGIVALRLSVADKRGV